MPQDESHPPGSRRFSILNDGLGSLGPKNDKGKRPIIVSGLITLAEAQDMVRHSPVLAQRTLVVRNALAAYGRTGQKDRRGRSAYDREKEQLPAIIPSLALPPGDGIANLSDATVREYHIGLYNYDLDEERATTDMAALREELKALPQTAMIGTSAGGDALYLIMAGPPAVSYKDHVATWESIARALPANARANSAKSSKNPQRLRFLAHDPEVYLNPDAVPFTSQELLAAVMAWGEANGKTDKEKTEPLRRKKQPDPEPSPTAELDLDSAIEYLRVNLLPEDGNTYNDFLASATAILAVRGPEGLAYYQSGMRSDRQRKMPGDLPTDNPADAPGKIFGLAQRYGWTNPAKGKTRGQQIAQAVPAIAVNLTPTPLTPLAASPNGYHPPSTISQDVLGGLINNSYFSLGQWYAPRLQQELLYDPQTCAWYSYAAGVWTELNNKQVFPHIVTPIIANRFALAQELVNDTTGYNTEKMAKTLGAAGDAGGWLNHDAGLMGGIQYTLTRPLPQQELHFLGTPDGVVDLRDGSIHPHSPDYGLRVLTAGRYRPDDVDYLRNHLESNRYDMDDRPIMDAANLQTMIDQVGLTLTGLATDFTAITFINGLSGSSKGGSVTLVMKALGGYAMNAPEGLLNEARGDIDAGLVDIIERQPRMIAHDEIAAETKIGIAKLLGLTGNKPLAARRPHGEMRSGVSIASIWTTAVDIPKWQTGQGMRRRLSIIQTARVLDDSEKVRVIDPEFLDAIITLGVLAAAAVYQPGYTPPYGDMTARKDVLKNMDDLSDWLLELDSAWHGYEAAKARESFNAHLEDEADELVTATAFNKAVNNSGRWRITLKNGGGKKRVRILELVNGPLLPAGDGG